MPEFHFEKPKKTTSPVIETLKIEDKEGIREYSKLVTIDNIDYLITLNPWDWNYEVGDSKIYEPSFGTQYGDIVTNKGLQTYNVIIEEIKNVIEAADKMEDFDALVFGASRVKLTLEEHEQLRSVRQDSLANRLKEDVHTLDGFIHEENGEKISILDGKISHTDINGKENIYEISDDISPEISKTFPKWLKVETTKFYFKDAASHDLVDKAFNESNKGSLQRLALYERTLKQKFPGYVFEQITRKDKTPLLVIYLNVEKAEEVRKQVMEKDKQEEL
jgi:hypothetical protein